MVLVIVALSRNLRNLLLGLTPKLIMSGFLYPNLIIFEPKLVEPISIGSRMNNITCSERSIQAEAFILWSVLARTGVRVSFARVGEPE